MRACASSSLRRSSFRRCSGRCIFIHIRHGTRPPKARAPTRRNGESSFFRTHKARIVHRTRSRSSDIGRGEIRASSLHRVKRRTSEGGDRASNIRDRALWRDEHRRCRSSARAASLAWLRTLLRRNRADRWSRRTRTTWSRSLIERIPTQMSEIGSKLKINATYQIAATQRNRSPGLPAPRRSTPSS